MPNILLKRLLTLLILLTPLIHSLESHAQQSVSGFVRDVNSGETLISANVAIRENLKGASTNNAGFYVITNLEPGTYTIVCSYIGFDLYEKRIEIVEGENLRLDIELNPANFVGEEIIVQADAEQEEAKDIGVAQISTALIKELPSVFEADVFRSIQLLPGVKAASDFSSGLYIRGGSPDQTLILLDRTTVYNPSHFFGFFSTFNPDAVKDVRLYKGGYPAPYGGRLGSVLDIYNKDGNRKKREGSLTVGMLTSRLSVEGPYSKGSYAFAFRRSTLEPLLSALRSSTDGVPDRFYFLDINGKINFDASENDKLSLSFYSGEDNVGIPFADDASFDLNYGNQTLSGTWTHIFSDKVFSNFTATASRYFSVPLLEIASTPIERDNNVWDFSIKGDVEYLLNDKHLFSTGFWAGNLTLKLVDFFDGQQTFTSRIQSQYGSFYLQDTWKPADKWEFILGTRLNYFSEGDYLRVEPRASAEFRPNNKIRLQAAYGRYNQFLTLVTNEAFSGFDIWLTSDDGVPPAYGDQFVLGAKTVPFSGYGFDVEVYYRSMKDLFDLDPFIQDAAGLDYADVFRFGEGNAYGAEFFFEKRAGRLTGFLGYTLAYTWRKYPGFNLDLEDPTPSARFYPPKYDRRNDINLVGSYRLSRTWKFTASFNYATGQAYTLPQSRYQTIDSPFTDTEQDVLVVGRVNASRLPSYHRLDIAFQKDATFFGFGQTQWQLQIINVYSRRNVWFLNYDFEENPIDVNEVNLLPILPTVSYTLNF